MTDSKDDPGNSARPRGRLVKIALRAVVALCALLLVLEFALGPVVKHGASVAGPAIAGVPVSIGRARVRLLSGVIDFGDVAIGAPEGFDANVFELGSFRVELKASSLFGGDDEPIEILNISIREPFVTYELKGLRSNLQTLLDKLGGGDDEDDDEAESKSAGRRVVIRHFLFDGAKVRVAVANGKGAVVPLPAIELSDIGAKSGGVTGIEAFAQILKSITVGTAKAAASVVADIGGAAVDAAVDAAGAAVGVAAGAADAAADTAKAAAGAIKSLFIGGAAAE